MNILNSSSVPEVVSAIGLGVRTALFAGDCLELIRGLPDGSVNLTVTSPPYCMGKEFDTSLSVDDFIKDHKLILPEIVRITPDGGSICWQVGYHVMGQAIYPLDYAVFEIMKGIKGIMLRNRIVWTFGHGLHSRSRFSGRHETVMWFTKGQDYRFDLDAVRVPQKYPGKRHYKGPRKGQFSGNPKGKNPSDVWEIPNVKSNHIEKLDHPCQFPVGLADRLVRALCPKDGVVFDPYTGTSSTGVSAILNQRRFVGAESNPKYVEIAKVRLAQAHDGTVRHRAVDKPIHVPDPKDSVAIRPDHFTEVCQ